MKFMLGAGLTIATLLVLTNNGITQTIRDLQRSTTSISGRIVQIYDEDFILEDSTGQILVEAEDRPLRESNLRIGETVTVTGAYDDDSSFDATSITRTSGEVVQILDD